MTRAYCVEDADLEERPAARACQVLEAPLPRVGREMTVLPPCRAWFSRVSCRTASSYRARVPAQVGVLLP